jgi:hypothetical protein
MTPAPHLWMRRTLQHRRMIGPRSEAPVYEKLPCMNCATHRPDFVAGARGRFWPIAEMPTAAAASGHWGGAVETLIKG